MKFETVTNSRSLQKLLTTSETFLRLGTRKCISLTCGRTIFELPSYYFVNSDGDVFDEDLVFQFRIDNQGCLHCKTETYFNKELQDSFTSDGIEEVCIKNNIIWFKKNGKYQKKFFYATGKRKLFDAISFEAVEHLSVVHPLKNDVTRMKLVRYTLPLEGFLHGKTSHLEEHSV